jgi:hypothetical protein
MRRKKMSSRPRLVVDLEPHQKIFLDRLPFGWKQQIFSSLIEMLIDMTERCGEDALGAILSKRVNLEDYFRTYD